ncbi:MAG: redoxin domain-containing protein [Bdellovibrionota bacterium]
MSISAKMAWVFAAIIFSTGADLRAAARLVESDFEFGGIDVVKLSPVSVALDQGALATVVVFLSAKCPCSLGHENAVSSLHRKYSPQRIQFIGIHSNAREGLELATSHFSNSKLPFPVLRDQNTKLADKFGALKTPHVFVVDPKGAVVFSGGIDDSKTGLSPTRHYLDQALQSIVDRKKPDPSEVKTLGCVIERS